MRRPRTADGTGRSDAPATHGAPLVMILVAALISGCASSPAQSGPGPDDGGLSDRAATDAPASEESTGGADDAVVPPPGNGPIDAASETPPPPAIDAAVGDSASAPDGGGTTTKPLMGLVKILILGSSNETDTCWRAFLWQKLHATGVTNFDFVGRFNTGPDCGVAGYDKDVEAQSGTIITGFSANDFATRFRANPPQIVLVHVGGADARNGVPIPTILKAYSLAVEQARLVNPQVILIVAQHTPQVPPTGISELNAAIPGWAMQLSTAQSPVSYVDLFTGIDQNTDQSDGTHLNVAGSQKVSDRWLAALLPLLKP